MTDTHAAYLERKHFAGLNGLRAVAIVAVVWHHAAHSPLLPMFQRGFVGVDLFFVLSGFLIATLLLREKAKTGRISLKNFWMRRILRLVPVYYLLLFALLTAYLVFKPGDPNTARLVEGFPVYALYLSNWFHPEADNLSITWSLATEEQFYLLWPLFEAFAAPFIAGGFWAAALILNQLVNFGVLDPAMQSIFGIDPGRYEILDATFTPILLGVGLAHLLNRPRGYAIARKFAGFRFAPALYAAALLALLNMPAADISGLFRLIMHVLMTLLIAGVVLQPQALTTKTLEWRPVVFVGAISYGMYLYHLFCIHAARTVIDKLGLEQSWFQFPLGLALTVAVSAASYYLYEVRFLDLRKKFRR